MQAIIMAAGRGTRLQTLNNTISKHMLEITPGKPILSHTLDVLPEEIDEVILVVNHLREHIQKFFGFSYGGRKIKYVVQEKLNGSGGAVWATRKHLREQFLVISGDDIYHPKDIKKMVQCNSYCILVHNPPQEEAVKAAVIEINGDKTIKKIVEYPDSLKSKSRLINTGLYKLDKKIFKYPLQRKKPGDPEFGLPQTLVTLAKDIPIQVIESTFWQMVNTPEDFQQAKKVYPKLVKDLCKRNSKKFCR